MNQQTTSSTHELVGFPVSHEHNTQLFSGFELNQGYQAIAPDITSPDDSDSDDFRQELLSSHLNQRNLDSVSMFKRLEAACHLLESEQIDVKQEYPQHARLHKRTLLTHHRREQVRRVVGMIESTPDNVCSRIKQIEVLSSDEEDQPKKNTYCLKSIRLMKQYVLN